MTYGIIKNKDGSTYVSPIFALKYAGWKSEAIVFDETFEKIKKIKMWDSGFSGIHRIVFVLENDFDTSGGDFAGYDWVINDKALFKALQSKKGVNIEVGNQRRLSLMKHLKKSKKLKCGIPVLVESTELYLCLKMILTQVVESFPDMIG